MFCVRDTQIFVGYITVLVSLLLLPLIDFRFFFAVGLFFVVCVGVGNSFPSLLKRLQFHFIFLRGKTALYW